VVFDGPAVKPRIFLIHALQDSQAPAWQAFAKGWPEAEVCNVLDDSLPVDLAADGGMSEAIVDRFLALSYYVRSTAQGDRRPAGILFTCSAFGPAIERVQQTLDIPVLRPNEAAFEEALSAGARIGLVVTFAAALPPLLHEVESMASGRGVPVRVVTAVADGALAALQRGDAKAHDRIVVQAVASMPFVDALVLCQFSLARAAAAIPSIPGRTVLTTPDSAVAKLRRLVGVRPSP
jgi:hypothetical protein